MSVITQGGSLTFDGGRVRFQNATELLMPFSGSIVVPRAPGQPADISTLSVEDGLQFALLYPQAAAGGGRRFPSLRTMQGEVLTVTGPVIVFAAQDHSVFNEIDLGAIFSGGSVLTPQFPEGVLTSSRPKYVVVTLDGNPVLPPDLLPEARDAGFVVRTLVGGLPGTLSGTIMAFDYAGMEVEADAALQTLGTVSITGAPAATQVRVQLVDVWGNVLTQTELPASALAFNPSLGTYDPARKLDMIQFTDASRDLQITRAQGNLGSIAEPERYRHRHVHVAVWPGHESEFHEIDGAGTKFHLTEGVPTGTPSPGFLRLCIYHPAQTMQTQVGGGIDEQGVFANATSAVPANGFQLCGKRNKVSVCNHGREFFRDFHDEIEAAQSGDELYLLNWKASAHLHLRGSMTAYGLGLADTDSDTVDAALGSIDQNRVLVPLGDDGSHFVLLADTADRGDDIGVSFHAEVRRLPSPTIAAKKVSAGFVRAGEPFGFVIEGDSGTPIPQEIVASWKNVLGEVNTTAKTFSPLPRALNRPAIPAGFLTLGIDAQDPPQATVIRSGAYADLLTQLGQPATANLRLLILNTTAGNLDVVELNQGTASAANVVLGTLPELTTAQDTLVAAVITAREHAG